MEEKLGEVSHLWVCIGQSVGEGRDRDGSIGESGYNAGRGKPRLGVIALDCGNDGRDPNAWFAVEFRQNLGGEHWNVCGVGLAQAADDGRNNQRGRLTEPGHLADGCYDIETAWVLRVFENWNQVRQSIGAEVAQCLSGPGGGLGVSRIVHQSRELAHSGKSLGSEDSECGASGVRKFFSFCGVDPIGHGSPECIWREALDNRHGLCPPRGPLVVDPVEQKWESIGPNALKRIACSGHCVCFRVASESKHPESQRLFIGSWLRPPAGEEQCPCDQQSGADNSNGCPALGHGASVRQGAQASNLRLTSLSAEPS